MHPRSAPDPGNAPDPCQIRYIRGLLDITVGPWQLEDLLSSDEEVAYMAARTEGAHAEQSKPLFKQQIYVELVLVCCTNSNVSKTDNESYFPVFPVSSLLASMIPSVLSTRSTHN